MRVWSWMVLAGCAGGVTALPETGSPVDTDPSGDTDADADTDADTDTDTDADTDSDTDTDTDADPERLVRFVALGDGGEGNTAQYAVGAAMKDVCAARGCDFALYLGDNIYDTGVSGVDDPQFQEKFELPYAELSFPFYVVLGNHDYGGEGLGVEWWKAQHEIDYTAFSTKWTMPDRYYAVTEGHVQLLGLDTNAILFDSGEDQEDWIEAQLADPTPSWRIAFGHHPYLSNGKHGNAGAYEGIPDWLPGAEIPRGDHVKEFIEERLCGRVDVYFSGHDHNRQWLEPACGTEFVVTGAAAKTTDDEGRGNPVAFEDFESPGFFWVEIDGDTLTGAFYDSAGVQQYTRTITR